MSRWPIVVVRAAALALVVSLLVPRAGFAHALFGDHNPDRALPDYVWIGFGHMIGGWDHLLFAAGVILLAASPALAAKLISVFVAGHSLTLLVATLAGVKVDAAVVDVVIALSLVYIGGLGFRGRPQRLRWVAAGIFAFGLIHGLGLSTRLQDLGLPDTGLVLRVVLFNVGVELGQLAALTVIVVLGTLGARQIRGTTQARRAICAAVAGSGLMAAVVMSSTSGATAATGPQDGRNGARGQRHANSAPALGGRHATRHKRRDPRTSSATGSSSSAPAQILPTQTTGRSP